MNCSKLSLCSDSASVNYVTDFLFCDYDEVFVMFCQQTIT